jgi:probable rRNA maturation factor
LTAGGLDLSVQYASDAGGVPEEAFIETCVGRALADAGGELVVRIVDSAESARLNEQYRGKAGPTNVLAFPAGDAPVPELSAAMLGDIVICADVVAREALEQDKPLEDHWAHMIIHGCLHLAGYDHEVEADARRMEQRERELLAGLGIADPYRSEA